MVPDKVAGWKLKQEMTCAYKATKKGSEFIDLKYPGRHTLIFGNSQKTVKKFVLDHASIGCNGLNDFPSRGRLV